MLFPLAGRMYAALMGLRARAYAQGYRSSWRPPVPCISVGNISWGGSGKTALCSWLMNRCRQLGLRPAVLTRGYRGRPPDLPYCVRPDSPVSAAGDEPLMLARENPEAWVVVDPCRMRGGKWVWKEMQPDIFILDDGFQHLAVQRDIDLVLLRPEDVDQDWNRIIPAGPWREGAHALLRASALIMHAKPELATWMEDRVKSQMPSLDVPVFSCSYQVSGLRRVVDSSLVTPANPYLLVSAVGSPGTVELSARQVFGQSPAFHICFPDHHAYTRSDWETITNKAESLNAQCIVCTPKDGVKLETMADSRLCILDAHLEFEMTGSWEDNFALWLEERLP